VRLPQRRARVAEALWRQRRLTLVLVSHDSSVVRRAQRIVVMSRGQLSIRQDSRA